MECEQPTQKALSDKRRAEFLLYGESILRWQNQRGEVHVLAAYDLVQQGTPISVDQMTDKIRDFIACWNGHHVVCGAGHAEKRHAGACFQNVQRRTDRWLADHQRICNILVW